MARCDHCKHWDSNEVKQAGDKFVIGLCTRAMPFWNATGWSEDYDYRILLPEFAGRKFFAQDGSDYRADVYTTPDFFCAEFDAAPIPS